MTDTNPWLVEQRVEDEAKYGASLDEYCSSDPYTDECPDCADGAMHNPVAIKTDGPLGHGFECGTCGAFLQAG